VTNAYLARRIAPAGFGAIGLAQSVISYLGLFSDAGLSIIAVREGAQDPSRIRSLIGAITGLRLLLTCVLLPVGLLASEFLPFSESSRAVLRVFALSLPLGALTVDWVFRALQRMHYAAIIQVATAALGLVLTVAFVRNSGHLLRVPWLSLFTGACAFILSLYFLAKAGHKLSVTFRFRDSRHYLAQSLPLCAASFAITLYIQANYLILGKVRGDAEVGLYAVASKVAGVFFAVTWLYYAAMAPALMEVYARSRRNAAAMLAESVRLTAAAGCGMAAVGAVGSGIILDRVFGAAFSPARSALAVMLFSGAVVAVTHNWGQLAIAAHRERLVLRATAIGGVANLIVCGVLVGRFGSFGAAIGTLVAEVVVGAVLILAWPREFGLQALRAAAMPAAVAVVSFLLGTQFAAWGRVAACCAVAIIYAAGLVVTRTVGLRDLERVRAALRKQTTFADERYELE
jgi:O-antigen/teichoic acid export membrane protein